MSNKIASVEAYQIWLAAAALRRNLSTARTPMSALFLSFWIHWGTLPVRCLHVIGATLWIVVHNHAIRAQVLPDLVSAQNDPL